MKFNGTLYIFLKVTKGLTTKDLSKSSTTFLAGGATISPASSSSPGTASSSGGKQNVVAAGMPSRSATSHFQKSLSFFASVMWLTQN